MTGNRRSLKWYNMTEIMRGFCRVEYGKSCLGKHTIITTSQLVPDTSNGSFCVSYAEGSLTFKLQLNTALLDFDRFEVRKNSTFQKSARKPKMLRFVLASPKEALAANLSAIRRS